MTGEFVEIRITPTWKRWGTKDWYIRGGDEVQRFRSLKEAKTYLKDRYGKARRQPMYCELNDGTSIRTGWVIHYSDYLQDRSRPRDTRLACQDWVSIRHCIYDYPFKQEARA